MLVSDPDNSARMDHRLQRIARGSAVATIVIGCLVLAGWSLKNQTLMGILPNWIAMRANTALGFVLSGLCLLVISHAVPNGTLSVNFRRTTVTCLSGVVTLIGTLTIAEYLFGLNLRIDQMLFVDHVRNGIGFFPGRVSPISASNLILTGWALLFLGWNRYAHLSQALACCITFITLVVLTGTANGLVTLQASGHSTAVALHTNLGFLLISAGILACSGRVGVMKVLTSGGYAGTVARSVLPVAVFLPLAFSWLCAWGKHLGYFGIEVSVSLFNIATIVTFTAIVARSVMILHRSELGTHAADARLNESLRRYRFLAEAMPEIIWTARPDGRADYFNRRWTEYTGLSSDHAHDWGWQKVLHPDDFDRCLERWKLSARTGCAYEIEYRFKRAADNMYRWHLGRAFPMRNPQGDILQWVGICTDIHDQKQARFELERRVAERTREVVTARERLQAVLDTATSVSIIAVYKTGAITVFNRGAELMLGYSREEMLGKWPTIFHLESEIEQRGLELSRELGRPVAGFDVFVERARLGKREENEWTYVRKDGKRLTVNLMVTASRNEEGEIVGFLGIATDITARKNGEERLRDQALILDLANDSIFVRDVEERIIYWNQGAQQLYGWTKEEAIGRVAYELLQTQPANRLTEIRDQLYKSGVWAGDLVHVRRDGSSVTVASSWTLQRDETNRPISVIQISHDITARKQAEAELEKSRQRLNTILYSSLDGVIVYDAVRDKSGELRDLRFSLINPAAEKLMEMTASHLIGHTLLEKFPQAVADGLYQKFAAITEGAGNREFDYVSRRFNVPRWYRIAAVKLGDGLVISYTEITARKKYERELHEAKERAELADRSKSDFLANMSHEIRTPMNGVIGMTGLLLDTRMDAEQRNLAETIRSSAESLLGLINDILDFSKVEAGKLSIEEIDFDLRKVVEDTMEIMAGQAQAKSVELVGGVIPGATTKLRGDPGRVQQVLTNLIGNAIKFTKNGDVFTRVHVEAETDTEIVWRFEIRDTGIGISPEAQARLFQPFVQADSSTSRRFGGTGLGLAICKRLVESMGGEIGVHSVRGEGSTFWFTLAFGRQKETVPEPELISELNEARVLIVDDNKSSRDFLSAQITAWRMPNDAAENGEEGLSLLRHAAESDSPYSLAIIDLQMPQMSGFTLAQMINADPHLNATRIMLLTPLGKSIPGDDLLALKIGASCTKPIRQSALLDGLAQALDTTRKPKTAPASSGPRAAKSVPIRTERLLLAEDNAVNQHVALGNLRKLGYNADVATDGMQVLEALETKTYDIILMDCQMPELDGYEATRYIRKNEKNGRHTWIIAMTANVMVGDREKCLAAGMDDYVSKPLRRAELRAALQRAPGTERKSFDESHLQRQETDAGELAELVKLFCDNAPQTMADLKRALDDGDAKALVHAAHTLKGSAGSMGAVPLAEICAEIEKAARSGKTAVGDQVDSAGKELHRLIAALESHMNTKVLV